jgi:outer membrane murein-binding lipoprotein Lpp
MKTTWPEGDSGSRRSGILVIGALVSAMLLAAGCAGNRSDGRAAVEAVTTLGVNATTESSAPSTTRKRPRTTVAASSTTRRQGPTITTGSATTKPKPSPTKPTATTKPEVKPKLTVIINNKGAAAGRVTVNPGGYVCKGTCHYDSYSKGTKIAFKITGGIEFFTGWTVRGGAAGQTTCDQTDQSCTFSLNDDTTVTMNFGAD